MPKKQILGSIIVLVLLSFVCMYIYEHYKVVNETKLVINEKENCIGNLDLYYTDKEGNNYYLYCLDSVIVDYGDRTLDLNKALDRKQIDMDFVYEQVKEDSKINSYDDGGSLRYSNSNFSLLSCKTTSGNNDYYFGPSDMEYREGFCEDKPYTCSFTRTYLVLDTSDSNDEKYIYLTLREYQEEEVVTVKVEKELISSIIEDTYYEFKFGSTGKSDKTDIKTIFESNLLLEILSTDKVETEQINEKVCK